MSRLLVCVLLCTQLLLCALSVQAAVQKGDVPTPKNSTLAIDPPAIPAGILPSGAGNSTGRKMLQGVTRYRVVVRSVQGSCMAVYGSDQDSKPYNWACNSNDYRQIWWWYPDYRVLQHQFGNCLSIYNGNNDSKPYVWGCNVSDSRQRWWMPGVNRWGTMRSEQGSCLAVYDGNNDSKPYGWSCNGWDGRQWWILLTV